MPKYDVARSIVVESSKEEVMESLKDFQEWENWSPWLIMDEEVQLEYSGNSKQLDSSYSWSSDVIGEGSMTLNDIQDTSLGMNLEFFKPFKTTSKVVWQVEEVDENRTQVTWTMYSSMPFFLFWMIKQMKRFIGMDFERGLKMFKEYLETGKVSSRVDVNGISTMNEIRYFGIEGEATFENIGEVMQKDFGALMHFVKERDLKIENAPFSFYKTFDMVKAESQFISCIPYSGELDLPEGWVQGKLDKSEIFKVTHKGSYENLSNAWATAFTHTRSKKIKIQKKPMGYEFYLNDPTITKSDELLTEVCLPLR